MTGAGTILINPMRQRDFSPPALASPRWFHRRLPGYAATPLRELPELAAQLGVGRLFVKDESHAAGLAGL